MLMVIFAIVAICYMGSISRTEEQKAIDRAAVEPYARAAGWFCIIMIIALALDIAIPR